MIKINRVVTPKQRQGFEKEIQHCFSELIQMERHFGSLIRMVVFVDTESENDFKEKRNLVHEKAKLKFGDKCPAFSVLSERPEGEFTIAIEAGFVAEENVKVKYKSFNENPYTLVESDFVKELWVGGAGSGHLGQLGHLHQGHRFDRAHRAGRVQRAQHAVDVGDGADPGIRGDFRTGHQTRQTGRAGPAGNRPDGTDRPATGRFPGLAADCRADDRHRPTERIAGCTTPIGLHDHLAADDSWPGDILGHARTSVGRWIGDGGFFRFGVARISQCV